MAAPLPAETTTIYLADGASLCLPAVRNVGEALAAAVANLKVQRPHARYLAVHAADATGAVAATPLGRVTAVNNGGRLVLLLRLWTPGLQRSCEDDAALRAMTYRQARICVLADTWPCPRRDGARAAAVQLADAAAPVPALAAVRAALPTLLARRVFRARPPDDWAVDITLELGARRRDPRAEVARDFLALAAAWPSFGTVAFRATARTPARLAGRRVVLRTSWRGIDVLGEEGESLADCKSPQRWVARGASVAFEAGDSRHVCRLETPAAARALLLLLDDYAAAAWAERPPRLRLKPAKRRDSLTGLYESLVDAIIRPPRASYDTQSLGPTSFEMVDGTRVLRRDFTLSNIRSERLSASHWTFDDDSRRRPCVLFCHTNSASRAARILGI